MRFNGDIAVPPGLIKMNDINGWMQFAGATWVY